MVRAATSEIVQFQIPAHLRESNPKLTSFLRHYYAWAEQEGNSLDFLRNMLQYKDIDTASELFADMTAKQFLKSLPADIVVDKKLLIKNIRQFFVAKGSAPSFEFLMNALFGENVSQDWQSQYVIRPSANEWLKTVEVVVEIGGYDFLNVVGSKITQVFPIAFGYVVGVTFETVNGVNVARLKLDHNKIINEFIPYATVKVLKNDVLDRSSSLDADHYFGTVVPSQDTISVTNGGALYTAGQRVKFIGGSGKYSSAIVSETSLGGVDSVYVQSGGSGYSVGDLVTSGDSDFSAVVSRVDGFGAEVSCVMELNNVKVLYSGYNYKVGDIIEASYLDRQFTDYPIQLEVATVDSSFKVRNVRIDNFGYGYAYAKAVLYDATLDALVSNFSAVVSVGTGNTVHADTTCTDYKWNSVYDIDVNGTTSVLVDNVYEVHVNGFNAVISAGLVGGVLTTVGISDGGWNYQDPIVDIFGDGNGAICSVTKDVNGTITGVTILNGGSGYTVCSVTIKEKFGDGANIVPLFDNATDVSGGVLTVNILHRGLFNTELESWSVPFQTITGDGSGFAADLEYRIKSVNLVSGGERYKNIKIDTQNGRGTGAILSATLTGGVVTAVDVLNGGSGYFGGTEVMYLNGVDDAILATTIFGGVITRVDVTYGGSGYVISDHGLLLETGEKLLDETSTPLEYATDDNVLHIHQGDAAIINADLGYIGSIVNANVITGGTGYWSTSEKTPLSVKMFSAQGSGCLLKPVLENGKLIHVAVISSGHGYLTSDTITVTGVGSDAVCVPTIIGSGVAAVTVVTQGSNYVYGTSAYVVGNGINAELSVEVETGITAVEVVSGGSGYVTAPALTVVDPTGSGAVLRAIVSGGNITSVEILSPGINYTAPTVTLGSGSLSLTADRHIKAVSVSNSGSDYTQATVFVVADGTGASVSCEVQEIEYTITNISLRTAGEGYTSIPSLEVSDISGYGAISAITVVEPSSGFNKRPSLSVTSSGTGASILGISDTIGQVEGVIFDAIGIDYDEISKISFPANVILAETNPQFKAGESLVKDFDVYPSTTNVSDNLDMEDGFSVLCENDDFLVFENVLTAKSRVGKIFDFDWATGEMRIDDISDSFTFITENNQQVWTEDSFALVDEQHESLMVGDRLVGVDSGASATILQIARASGFTEQTGTARYGHHFKNNAGKTNTQSMKIHNSERFQDFAYVLSSNLTMNQYESFIKEVVHPAGYKMFGDVQLVQKMNSVTPTLPTTDEGDSSELFITMLLSPAILPYLGYEFVERNMFNYVNTPMHVFGTFTIEQLTRNDLETLLRDRLMIGRQESEVSYY